MKYLIIVLLIVLISFIGFGLLILFNSGNPKPFTDMNGKVIKGSISEKIFLNINGCKQGLIIKGKNIDNPVLLYLHGGMADYFLTQNYPTGLENLFTVVWWEQRGTGISYDKNMSKDKLTTRQLIEDTKELSKYLIKRFGKQKIYLMGHSGGTFIGIQTAAESPELFHAYMAVAQITNQFQSEKLAYNYMLKQYEQNGDKQMMKKLKAAEITGDTLPESYLKIRDKPMHKLGIGTMRNMKSIVTGLFFPSLLFEEYTMTEKWRLWQAKAHSGISVVWSDMIKTDIPTKVHELKIPIWFFHGEHDYTVSYPLAKAYFEKIKAPEKQFFSFKESAHSPIFEEPERCLSIIQNFIIKN
jgi:pimeloyl-ACP methyl ester carboxylesterase